MNIYILDQTRRGSVFGVGTYIRELVAVLKGCDVNLCVINLISEKLQIQTERVDGIEYWHFPLAIADQRTTSNQEQWDLYYRNVAYLLRLHIKNKKDLIFHLNFFESGKLAEELKSLFDCRIVAVSHFFDWGFTIYDNPERLRRILKEKYPNELEKKLQAVFEIEKSYYSLVDHIICITHYMRRILSRDYGIDRTKISVIPNGLRDVYDMSTNIVSLREKWNISAEEKIILFAGRIDEVKGVIYLIRAFREVLKINKNCHLIMAGSGDYDKCFKECKDICPKITFTGLLEKQDLHELYQMADIGVVPSLFEPFGYVAVEMMMHNLPVVVTATSGLNEVVDDTCGLKIPLIVLSDNVGIDTTLFSEKILYLLENSADAKRMGVNGRRRYLQYYSSKIFCKNMFRIYKSICT